MIQGVRRIALAALIASSGASAAPASPVAFLESIYARYVPEGRPFNPLGIEAPRFFTPGLLALVRRDRIQARGEVGQLDGDPICACQDFGPLTGFHYTIGNQTPARTEVTAEFINQDKPTRVHFTLKPVSGGWRIDDIAEPGIPSLRRLLGGR